MANTIEYADSPNVNTAFVVQQGGQKNRAVLTAPQDTTTLELPDNPNSTKGFVTIDGKKHKVVLTADISGNGGGGDSLPDQTNHEGQFLFTNGSTASWRDDVFSNTTSHVFSVDETTSEVYVQIYPKENRNCFARVRVYDTWDDGGTLQRGMLLRTDYFRFDYYDISDSQGNDQRTEQITPCMRSATPNVFAGYRTGNTKCFGFIMTFSEEESKDYIVDIDYSDGVESITYNQNVQLNQVYATANILFNGEQLTWLDDEFPSVVMANKTNGLFTSDLRDEGLPYFIAKYTEAPDPSTVTTPWQYIGETDSDYVKGYFYDRTQSDDRNATATVTSGSFSVSINQTTFAEHATQDYPNVFVEWAYETRLQYSQSQGGWYSPANPDTVINLASVGITITGTVYDNDRFTVAYGDMYKWKQTDVQPSGLPVPPTTPNTVWVLKATVDANGDATIAWVQEV